MTDATNAVMASDSVGEEAFRHFDRLLSKVQVGSSSRAKGPALRVAKKEYAAYLPVLQPIGQAMLDRALDAMEQIQGRLVLPHGYGFSNNGVGRTFERTFVAGQFQLNHTASLYIQQAGPATDDSFGAEVRIFTRSVRAFVPVWVGTGPVRGRAVQVPGSSEFVYAESYGALVDKIVARVQTAINQTMSD